MAQTHLLVIIVLLAGQASCNQTSTTSSPLTGSTTATQITVFYVVDIAVAVTGQSQNESDIIAWLDQVFRTNLDNCVSPNPAQTTATPTSPQATPASTFNETTQVTILQSNSTDATSPTLEGNNTTTASTTSEGNNATTAATSEGNNTTPAATTSEGNITTRTTLSEGNNTISTATTSEGNNLTTIATTATSEGNNNTATVATTSTGINTTSPATTSEGNNLTTIAITATSEGNNNTTTSATTSEGNITTRAATLSEGNNTISTATTSEGNNLTTIATTATSEGNNLTTIATTATSEGNNLTTIATTATSEGNNNTATVATSTDINTTPAGTSTDINTTPAATTSTGISTTPTTTTSTGISTTAAPTTSRGISTTPAPTTSRGISRTPAPTTSRSTSTTPAPTTSRSTSTTPAPTTSRSTSTTPAPTTSTDISTTPALTTSTGISTTPAPTTSTGISTTPAPTTSTDISTTPAPTTSTDISTTPAPTTSTGISTTPAPTTSTGISTTPAPTTSTDISTTPAPTTSTGISTTPAPTTSTGISTTPAPTTSTGFTTVTSTQNILTPTLARKRRGIRPNSNSVLPTRIRSVREVSGNETQSSLTNIGTNTVSLFQGMNVSCAIKTAIRNTSCSVTLKLSQPVPSCCILRTLCAASNTTSDFYVVAEKADRMGQLQNECNSSSAEENSCVYSGQANATCNASVAAYVVPQSNSANCSANNISKINCSCSSYCNGSDAYYTFDISIQDPNINSSYVSSLISTVQQSSVCNQTAKNLCPFNNLTSQYKDAYVICQNQPTNFQSCKVILVFGGEVSVCSVAEAVMSVIQSEKQIVCNGRVTRAAICGNLEVNSNPLLSEFTWISTNLTSANFCAAAESNSLTCQNGKNVVVQLQEQCDAQGVSTTTTSPNVTSVQPNGTTIAINVTSTPLNTTTGPLNTTEAVNVTTTTSAGNVSVTVVVNTTASNTTASNTTTIQPSTVNLTTQNPTTTNQATSVTTIQPPATTASAEGQANALLELTKDVSKLNSSQVNQLVSQLEGLLSGPTVSLALGNTSVNIVSNLLGASPDVLSASSSRMIRIVDTVGLKLVLGATAQTVLSPAVAVSVKSADGANFQQTVFSISNPANVQVRGASRRRRSAITDPSIPQGSIKLPPTLTQNLSPVEQRLVSRVQFNFYQTSTVFQDKSLGVRTLNSGILGASVANLSITGLQDNVIITLKNKEPVPANFVATCVFWNFTFNNGLGGWSSNGCSVQNSTGNETICACNHLTSFAILLDLSRTPITSRTQSIILTYITYIGCGVSAIFLSITLLTYLAFGKLRKDIPSKILIQLCLALLMLNLVFLVDAWLALYPDAVGLCISTAWFLHYFLLASFTWMGLEAVHMYVALVKVFNLNVSHYMLKFSLAGWGVPMIVVIIVISINPNNYGLVQYGRFTDGTTDDFCWLRNDIAFYVAVVAYFCAIFLFNVIMFIVVMVQLCRIKRQNPHNLQHRSTLQDVRSVMGITVLLGLTWGFAFFAWGPVNLAFMYLFAIFNTLQGFFIFVFHCAAKESVRRQWKTYLCCGNMRLPENSEWSRTATQKTGKKSSVTNHSKASRGNNSSSSSSFLVSDVSEQTNGIGSSFADRVITADEDPNMDVVLNEVNRRHRNPQTS